MSEVKLYVWDASQRDDDYRYATTAEIMDAHPKCGECRHYLAFDNGLGECNNAKQTYRCDLTPTDYCRHWEGKE